MTNNQIAQIGSAICKLEPYFLRCDILSASVGISKKHKDPWWSLVVEFAPLLKELTPFFHVLSPISFSDETQVLLALFYEEFFGVDIDSKECRLFMDQEFIEFKDATGNKTILAYKEPFSVVANSGHDLNDALRILLKWLNPKGLPQEKLKYLVSPSRIRNANALINYYG